MKSFSKYEEDYFLDFYEEGVQDAMPEWLVTTAKNVVTTGNYQYEGKNPVLQFRFWTGIEFPQACVMSTETGSKRLDIGDPMFKSVGGKIFMYLPMHLVPCRIEFFGSTSKSFWGHSRPTQVILRHSASTFAEVRAWGSERDMT